MATEILISVRPLETRVAYVENGLLSDLKIERKTSPTLVGSIHRGKVTRVLPGMQAAFVDIGLERAAFLYVGDVVQPKEPDPTLKIDEADESEDKALVPLAEDPPSPSEERPNIQDLLQEGQCVLVQVAKDPLGTKGARLTTHISLPGRYLVYMPTLTHVGISRRISNELERDRLRKFIEKSPLEGGVIVRTACEGAPEAEVLADLEYLKRLWKDLSKSYEKRKTAGMIHSEMDVELRALRDLLSEDIDKVVIDDEVVFKKASRFIGQFMPKFRQKVQYYDKLAPLFDSYDIDLEISRSLDRKVWLKSGGYIVIDEAEALVVVDVNTGRYVGKRDLEDTILKTNLEAAREFCQQMKIRNVGGIIIIDFIDMEKQAHREMLLTLLEEELKKDRARTKIVTMSELGLVEMTRKRIRPSLSKTLCEPCGYCDGKGYIKRKSTIVAEIFLELERGASFMSSGQKPIILCHADIVDWIYEVEELALARLEQILGVTPVFKLEPQFHIEQYEISAI